MHLLCTTFSGLYTEVEFAPESESSSEVRERAAVRVQYSETSSLSVFCTKMMKHITSHLLNWPMCKSKPPVSDNPSKDESSFSTPDSLLPNKRSEEAGDLHKPIQQLKPLTMSQEPQHQLLKFKKSQKLQEIRCHSEFFLQSPENKDFCFFELFVFFQAALLFLLSVSSGL